MTAIRRTLGLLGLALAGLAIASPPALSAPLVPDIQTRPLPTDAGDPEIDGDELRFSNAWANHGQGPWETAPAGPASADDCDGDGSATNDVIVIQRVFEDANGNGVFERGTDTGFAVHPGGCMVFHPGHGHFHVEDAGLYSLLEEPSGAPAGASSKVSFCLLDIDYFDLTLPGAPPGSYYDSCSASVQGISVGWFDEYGLYLSGQSIDISGLESGENDYCLRSQFDPESRFPETNEANNIGEQRYSIDPDTSEVTPLSGPCNVPPSPDTTITSGPADGSAIADPPPTFAFESTEPESTFECRIDAGEFATCASPHTTATLSGGSHVIAIRAIGPVGFDDTPATRSFTIDSGPGADTTAPETAITRGPNGKTHDRTPRFRFRADEPATFECRLDRRRWRSCSSPRTYAHQALGRHKFKVRATDLAGNVEPQPAKQRFKLARR